MHFKLIVAFVEEHLIRHILENIAEVGIFGAEPGTGIAALVGVEDADNLQGLRRDYSRDAIPPTSPD